VVGAWRSGSRGAGRRRGRHRAQRGVQTRCTSRLGLFEFKFLVIFEVFNVKVEIIKSRDVDDDRSLYGVQMSNTGGTRTRPAGRHR
jgi:hypothetical protein